MNNDLEKLRAARLLQLEQDNAALADMLQALIDYQKTIKNEQSLRKYQIDFARDRLRRIRETKN